MTFQRVLVAIDTSSLGTDVLRVAGDLVRCTGAQAALVCVADSRAIGVSDTSPPYQLTAAKLRDEARAVLAEAAARIVAPKPPELLIREGLPDHELVAAAHDWHADLLIMGTHGRTGLAHLFKGSVAEWILHHAPCPVLVVKIGSQTP